MKQRSMGFIDQTIQQYLAQLDDALLGTERGDDLEPLHQARVVSRRLRMALGIFKKQFDHAARLKAKNSLRKLEKVLGPARDVDTELRFLVSLATTGSQSGAARVIKELENDRRKLQPGVVRAVRAMRQGEMLERITAVLEQPVAANIKETQKATDRLAKLGRKRIKKRLKRLLDYAPYTDDPDNVRKLHCLRIAAKYLRYTLEIFRPYYGKKLDTYISAAHTIQNTLGDYHDLEVWGQSLAQHAGRVNGNPAVQVSIQQCVALCKGRRPQAYRDFLKAWKNCQEKGMWDKLIKLVSKA